MKIKKIILAFMLLCTMINIPSICYARDPYTYISAGTYDGGVFSHSSSFENRGTYLAALNSSDYVYYEDVEFTSPPSAIVVKYGYASGYGDNLPITFHLDAPDGPVIAIVKCACSESWGEGVESKAIINMEIKGTHTIYYKNTNNIGNLFYFYFMPGAEREQETVNYLDVTRYEKEINIASQLNILDIDVETRFDPTLPVKRKEAVNAIWVLSGKPVIGGNPVFSDVDVENEYFDAVQYAYSRGIITGSDGKFYPEDMIKTKDAIVMFTRALGYQPYAEAAGGYTEGYMKAAEIQKLTKGLSLNDILRREELAKLVYNILNADSYSIDTISGGAVEYRTTELKIESEEIKKANGIVSGTYMGSLYSPGTYLDKNMVVIDGEEYYIGNTPAQAFLGANCEFYYTEDDGDKTLLAIVENKKNEEIVSISLPDDENEILDIGFDVISWSSNGKTKTKKLNDTIVIYNGKTVDWDIFKEFPLDSFGGSITVFNNGVQSIMKIERYENIKIGTIDEDWFINSFTGEKIQTKDAEVKVLIDGMGLGLNNLSYGDVGVMFRSLNKEGDTYIKISIVNKTVSGTVSSISEDKAVINGEKYNIASECKSISLGTQGEFKLNIYGEILDYEFSGYMEGTKQFGILIDKRLVEENGEFCVIVKIANENASGISYKLYDKVILDGKRRKTAVQAMYGTDEVPGISDAPNYSPVYYNLNADGDISIIDTCLDGVQNNNDRLTCIYKPQSFYYRNRNLFDAGRMALKGNQDVQVIRIWDYNGNIKIKTGKITQNTIPDSGTVYGGVYSTNREDISGDIFIQTNVDNTYWRDIMVFDETEYTIDNNDETCIILKAYRGSTKVSYTVNPDAYVENSSLRKIISGISKGDCIKVNLDDYGMVVNIEVKFLHDGAAALETGVNATVNRTSQYTTDTYQSERLTYGTVKDIYDKFLILEHSDGTSERIYYEPDTLFITVENGSGGTKLNTTSTRKSIAQGDEIFIWITDAIVRQMVRITG